ncbi:MAG: hypothetical protein A2144_05480 [Chloroflexi bacterium RBG_16_50_9]|nr:MAG: hypothetical protein A2144_05480 [Chloroflexi bacterium RBG_16_50_9]
MIETLKQKAQRLLSDVPGEYVFRSSNGHILRNLKELNEELNTMSGESYATHVNKEKNDFTNWVRDVIRDEELARNLQKTPNQAQAAKMVSSRITTLSKVAA